MNLYEFYGFSKGTLHYVESRVFQTMEAAIDYWSKLVFCTVSSEIRCKELSETHVITEVACYKG